MKTNRQRNEERIADLPVSPVLKVIRHPHEEPQDEEAIDWAEVGRLLYEREWGPILELPMAKSERFFWQRQMENGVDASAFATVDFQRQSGYSWNPIRYKLGQLRTQRQNVKWTLEMVMDRITYPKKHEILRYIREGIIEPDMCESMDMFHAARLYRRWLWLGEQIEQMKKAKTRRCDAGG